MNKAIFKTVAFLTVMFFCFSCDNALQETQNENIEQGMARLRLNIADAPSGNARTIFAPNNDTATSYTYKLKGRMQGKSEETISYNNAYSPESGFSYSKLLSAEFLIKIGTWEYITLSAYKSSECVYSATLSNVEIIEGTNELTFDMSEKFSGYGGFNVTVYFPGDVKKVQAAVFRLDGRIYENYRNLTIFGGKYVDYSYSSIAAGVYILSFKFFKSDGTEIKPGYSELIQIKSNLTSKATRTLENLEKLHSIKYNLNGGEISGDSIPMSFIEQESVLLPTAQDISKLGYDFVGWYTTVDFNGDVVTEIPSGTKNDIALFAKWNPTLYKITYEGVEGIANDNPETYTIEDEITLSALEDSQFLKFEKWLLNGKTITVIPKGTTGDIVLLANWKVTMKLTAEEAIASLAQKISEQSGEEPFSIIITGTLTSEQLSSIAQIIKNSGKKIELDLSKATGLDKISANTFKDCTKLESIVIPRGVTEIESNAFYGCTSLKTITVPGTLVKIGTDAFCRCLAINTVHCASVESWRKIEFGNDYNSNPLNPLKSDRKAYANGNDITDAIYTYKISYAGVNGASNSNPKTYDSRVGLTLANPVATTKFDGWTLNGEKVTEISIRTKGDITLTANWKEGFYATAKTAAAGSLKSWLENQTGVGPFNVNITGTLTSDYLSAIVTVLKTYPKKLVRLDLSEITGLTELSGFSGCESLETIIIPKGVKTIGNSAFKDCTNLTDVTLPDSIETLGTSQWDFDGVFHNCSSLTNVYFDGGIGNWCAISFGDTYSNNPLYYAKHFFIQGKEEKNIVIPNGVTAINSLAFRHVTYIESITIPGSVQTIYGKSFYGCTGLKTVTINNGTKTIENSAFKDCTNLTDVTLPRSIETIGGTATFDFDGVFHNCSSLTNVYFNGGIDNWCTINFGDTYSNNPLYYAKHFFIQGEEKKDIVIPNGVTAINSYAFRHVKFIESVTIPGSVQVISDKSFYECTGLKTVIINNGTKTIKNSAFKDCTNLTDVTLPGSIETLGTSQWDFDGVFHNCSSLTNVYFDGGIGNWCAISFGDTYSNNPLYYAKHFYKGNEEATDIKIKGKNINKYAFYNCTSIQSVTIESEVTYIGAKAFYGCINLTSVTFKDTVGWSCGDVTDATANAAKLRTTGNGNWGDSDLRKK